MRSFGLVFVVAACATPTPSPAPSASAQTAEPFPPVTVFRLDLADEPWGERTMRDTDQLDDVWMARPEAPVVDWAWWFALMHAHGVRSFDLSTVEAVDWQALSQAEPVRLSLAGRRLDDDVRAFLAKPSALRWIDLSQTRASDAECAALAAHPLLHRVALAQTKISDACLQTLASLQRLERVSLAKTGVTDVGVVKLTALPLLSDIVLSSTAVTDVSVVALLDHFALRRIDVNDTSVTKAAAHAARTTSLERVDLGDTHVTPRVVASLVRHPYLRYLSLAGVGIGSAELAKIAQLRRLETLDLTGAHVDKLTPLEGMERLTHLSVAETPVADLSSVRRLPSLSYLDASSTKVTDLSPVAALRELRTLDVSKTAVSSLSALSELPHVRELQLAETQLDDAALQILKAFPALEVVSVAGCVLHDVSVFGELRSLQRLSLASVAFRSETLKLPRHLVMLNVNSSSFADIDTLPSSLRALHIANTTPTHLASLARLKQLTTLNVSGLSVDREQMAAWKLPRLRVLNASQTRLRELHGAVLPRSLEKLYVLHTGLTDADLPTRDDLPYLEHFDVTGTEVTAEGLRAHGF